jgi:hypothetical protein
MSPSFTITYIEGTKVLPKFYLPQKDNDESISKHEISKCLLTMVDVYSLKSQTKQSSLQLQLH